MKLKWLKEMGSEYGHSYFIPPFLFSYKTKIRKEACPYEVLTSHSLLCINSPTYYQICLSI